MRGRGVLTGAADLPIVCREQVKIADLTRLAGIDTIALNVVALGGV